MDKEKVYFLGDIGDKERDGDWVRRQSRNERYLLI
jgi:hypothetical protein